MIKSFGVPNILIESKVRIFKLAKKLFRLFQIFYVIKTIYVYKKSGLKENRQFRIMINRFKKCKLYRC